MTTVVCTTFILVVVFVTATCMVSSSRRTLAENALDVDAAMGQRKTESMSMNTLRMKGVGGHGISCVVNDDVSDLMLSPDTGNGYCDGQCVCVCVLPFLDGQSVSSSLSPSTVSLWRQVKSFTTSCISITSNISSSNSSSRIPSVQTTRLPSLATTRAVLAPRLAPPRLVPSPSILRPSPLTLAHARQACVCLSRRLCPSAIDHSNRSQHLSPDMKELILYY